MCGPSKEMKALNAKVQQFSDTMSQEAGQVFGDASSIFNDVKTSLSSIVKGGPSQQGWSAAETNAVNSQIINQAAVNARNVNAATGNAMAAVGGGNVALPSGLSSTLATQANLGVEAQKSQQLSQATVQNYETGRQNYFKAVDQEKSLTDVFNPAQGFNAQAGQSLDAAQKSQADIDKATNWWQPMAMNAIQTGATMAALA